VLSQLVNGGGAPDLRAAVQSFDADGVTFSFLEVSATGLLTRKAIGLALRGGRWAAGSYTIDGSTSSATATVSGLAFQPKGGIGFTAGKAESASDTADTHAQMSIGCWTSTSSRRAIGIYNEDNAANVEINHAVEYDAFLALPSNAGALAAAYDIDAVNADGFRVIVDAAGGVASEWHAFLVFDDTGGQTVAIGQASDTSSALASTALKTRAVGQPSEADSAQALTINGSRVYLDVAHGRELRDENNSPWANVNGWDYAWYDDPDALMNAGATPAGTGSFNTNAAGEATFDVPGTTLTNGQRGLLLVRHPDYDEATYPLMESRVIQIGA